METPGPRFFCQLRPSRVNLRQRIVGEQHLTGVLVWSTGTGTVRTGLCVQTERPPGVTSDHKGTIKF